MVVRAESSLCIGRNRSRSSRMGDIPRSLPFSGGAAPPPPIRRLHITGSDADSAVIYLIAGQFPVFHFPSPSLENLGANCVCLRHNPRTALGRRMSHTPAPLAFLPKYIAKYGFIQGARKYFIAGFPPSSDTQNCPGTRTCRKPWGPEALSHKIFRIYPSFRGIVLTS